MLTIIIIQYIAAFCLVLDLITRLYVTGVKSIQIAKYTIFVNDLIILVNLTINNILYFSQKNLLLNYLGYLNLIFGFLLLFRLICIILFLRNIRKKQKNVRVRIKLSLII